MGKGENGNYFRIMEYFFFEVFLEKESKDLKCWVMEVDNNNVLVLLYVLNYWIIGKKN